MGGSFRVGGEDVWVVFLSGGGKDIWVVVLEVEDIWVVDLSGGRYLGGSFRLGVRIFVLGLWMFGW